MASRSIRVTVVRDDFLTRAGLTATFSGREEMAVQSAELGDARLAACDVVVADYRCGLEVLLGQGRQRMPQRAARVVIVADTYREWQIRRALERGAAGYLLLDTTPDELVEAVHTVHHGSSYLSPALASRLAESLTAEPLTARESQVLALVTEGLCNKHIAARLEISLGTVKTHLRALFEKLQVRTRTAAAAVAERRGLLR